MALQRWTIDFGDAPLSHSPRMARSERSDHRHVIESCGRLVLPIAQVLCHAQGQEFMLSEVPRRHSRDAGN